jgi:hypothetical protein
MTDLLPRRVSKSRAGTEGQDDYDVVGADGLVIGRIFKASTPSPGAPWMWSLAYRQQEDRTPTHGYVPTREATSRHSPRVSITGREASGNLAANGIKPRLLDRPLTLAPDGARHVAASTSFWAINKPFECRSAVLPSPSFRPMPEGYIRCSAGPSFFAAKGKTAGGDWRKHGNPGSYRRSAQR